MIGLFKIRTFVFILLGILALRLSAEPVKIMGTAPGAEGKTVQMIRYDDLITFTEKVVAKAVVDTSGNFTLEFDAQKTFSGSMAIDFHRADLFVEPGKKYYIAIGKMDYDDAREINPFIQSQSLDVNFKQYDMSELNSLVQQFNIIYNNFLLDNFNALYRDHDKSRLDTFRIKVVTSFAEEKNVYFNNYVKYKMAGLEQLCQSISQMQLGKKYFAEVPIQYENVEYMDFFNTYFSKYLTVTSRALKFKDYRAILSGASPYEGMMKVLATDSILHRPQIRELVMLKGLMEMYKDTSYSKEAITGLLSKVAAESNFPDNKVVAGNILTYLTRLKPGSPAPVFKLKDRNQKSVSLEDFKGKPVLLNFWTTYCEGCTSEMDLVKPLYDKYSSKMGFISISADKDFIKMLFFINLKSNYVWNFLHVGDEIELLKQYDVRIYPLFVLIDKDGKIWRYPAENPSAGLEGQIKALLGTK
jgi:peroxiredoxin